MNTRNFASLPNMISLGRLFLAPAIVTMIAEARWPEAFAIFLIAGVSDGVDGWLAKRFDLRSDLGAVLDPLADKALLVSIYATLGFGREIPAPLAILIVFRDVLIVGGVVTAWVLSKPVEIKPLFISKLNTAAQIAYAALVLAARAYGYAPGRAFDLLALAVAALTLASTGAYLGPWIRRMSH